MYFMYKHAGSETVWVPFAGLSWYDSTETIRHPDSLHTVNDGWRQTSAAEGVVYKGPISVFPEWSDTAGTNCKN